MTGARIRWQMPRRGGSGFERSARFWMTAYPRRWRDAYGEDLLGVLGDVASREVGTLPRRLPRVEVVGLLRAGWGLRWRERPPLRRLLAYRFLDVRLPERCWWWVVDDIRSPWYPVVRTLWTAGPVVLILGVAELSGAFGGGGLGMPFWFIYAGGLAGLMYFTRNHHRRRAWIKHIADGRVPEAMRSHGP